MQVRAGNASGFADFADDLSLSDIITRFDGNFFQMRVDGKQLVAVVDDDGVAGENITAAASPDHAV